MAAPVTAESIDKSSWTLGPWRSEADLVSIIDAPTGYAILLNRDPTGGHWLAYVGVPAGDISYGVADPLRVPVGAMGGLSYAGPLASGDTTRWWLGFSCGSAGALQPLLGAGAVYVTQGQALALAKQLALDLFRFGRTAAAGILGLAPVSLSGTPSTPATPATPATPSVTVPGVTVPGVTVPPITTPPVTVPTTVTVPGVVSPGLKL